MKYKENEYIVHTEIYYTYWIIHTLPSGEKYYYHGVRFEYKHGVDIRALNDYHSSSRIVNALYRKHPEQFEKRIDKICSTKEEAQAREIYVHNRLHVDKNKRFYNLRKASKNFNGNNNTNYVTCIINNKNVSIKSEQFIQLQKTGLANGVAKNTITAIDENGNYIRVAKDDFINRNLHGVTKGKRLLYNKRTGQHEYFTKEEEAKLNTDEWVTYNSVFKQYKLSTDISDNPSLVILNVNDKNVLNRTYVPYCKDMVTVYDSATKKYHNKHKSNVTENDITAASNKEIKDYIKVIDENLNFHKIRKSKLTDEYYPISKFKIQFKSKKGIIYLFNINENTNISELKIKNIVLYDKINDYGVISTNIDKRLLNFKRYEAYPISVGENKLTYIYFNTNNEYVFTKYKHNDMKLLCEFVQCKTWIIYIPNPITVNANYFSKIRKYTHETINCCQN